MSSSSRASAASAFLACLLRPGSADYGRRDMAVVKYPGEGKLSERQASLLRRIGYGVSRMVILVLLSPSLATSVMPSRS
jgi:hypothetical protein